MNFKPTDMIAHVLLLLIYFLASAECKLCSSGLEIKYCDYGCCFASADICCDGPNWGLIIGLVFGIGGTLVIAVVIILICRRRRSNGFVYTRNVTPGASTVVISQTNTSSGVIHHGAPQYPTQYPGVHHGGPQYPGTTYPQPYNAYPPQPQPMPQGQPMMQPQFASAFAQGPPAYNDVVAKK